jgi:hypothetical protein
LTAARHADALTMDKAMIAYCGINCTKCPAYSFPRLGEKLHMKGLFQSVLKSRMKPKPEGYVVCDGCTAVNARCVTHCLTCPVRSCAAEMRVENCASCDKFRCERLESIWKITVFKDAQPRLEQLHAERQSGITS